MKMKSKNLRKKKIRAQIPIKNKKSQKSSRMINNNRNLKNKIKKNKIK